MSSTSSDTSYDSSGTEYTPAQLLGVGAALPHDVDINARMSIGEQPVGRNSVASKQEAKGASTTTTTTSSSSSRPVSATGPDSPSGGSGQPKGLASTRSKSGLLDLSSERQGSSDSLGSSKRFNSCVNLSSVSDQEDVQSSHADSLKSSQKNATSLTNLEGSARGDAPQWADLQDPALLLGEDILDSPAERADADEIGTADPNSGGAQSTQRPSPLKGHPAARRLGVKETMSTPSLPKVDMGDGENSRVHHASKRSSVNLESPVTGGSGGNSGSARHPGSRLAQVMIRRSTTNSRGDHSQQGSSGLSVRTSAANSVDKAHLEKLDRSEWLAMAMRKHPEVLELRERLRPLSRASSFARIYNAGTTEVRQTLSRETLLTLVMQHLWCEGLRGSVKCLEEESGVKFENSHHGDSQLRHLVRMAVRDADKVFDLTIGDKPTDHDPEVEFQDHLTELGVVDHEEDDFNDEHIWDTPPDSVETIVLADGDDPECRTVKAATLNKLIERLTSDKTADLKFQKTFLLTHRSFTTSEKLLEKLMQRYDVPPDAGKDDANNTPGGVNVKQLSIQLRVFNFLRNWIESCFFDFTPSLVQKLNNFIDNTMARDGNQKLATQLRMTIQRQLDGRMKTIDLSLQFSEPPPEPKVPRNIFSPKLSFEDIDEEEVARQLCLMEFQLFARIKPAELLNQAWSKPKLKYRAPNVLAMITRFNTFSSWVASMIIGCEKLRQRKSMMARFVKVAENLRKYNNFNTLMAVVAGLNNSAVHRLKVTREEMTKRHQETLAELVKLMSSDSAYKTYRKALQQSEPPAIPYLGVYLTDLTFVEEGNPDSKNGLINFAKRQLVCNVISELQQYQQTSYNLQEVLQVVNLLNKEQQGLPSEQELYRLSLLREPRGCTRSSILQ